MPTERKKRAREGKSRPAPQHLPFLTVVLLLLIAFYFLHGPVRSWLSGRYRAVSTFDKALGIVLDEYVDPLSPEEVLPGAINGMVRALKDPHSHYLPPADNQRLAEDESGKYAGIGVRIMLLEGEVVVREVFKGAPGDAAGLLPGDSILAAGEHDLTGIKRPSDATKLVRGKEGTAVRLRIRRGGAEFETSVTRQVIPIPVVEFRIHSGSIGLVRISGFPDELADKVEKALEALHEKGIRSLILDLRSNEGGFLDEAVAVADLFIAEGVIVSTRSRHERDSRIHRAEAGGSGESLPLAVLVNRHSASAAEVLAGTLQAHGRAKLVGTRTYGKGAVNKRFPLPGGHGLLITTGRYFLPNGEQIEGKGLTPDIEVQPPRITKKILEDLRAGDPPPDPQLDAAIRFLRDGTTPVPPEPEATPAPSARDTSREAFDKALRIILAESIDPISPGDLIAGVIAGMVGGLKDPHSRLIPPDELARLSKLETPLVGRRVLEERIGYLGIAAFAENASEEAAKALKHLNGKTIRALVLDLRGTDGGSAGEAARVADLFVPKGEMFTTRARRRRDSRTYQAKPGGPGERLLIAVLVDRSTGGVAEAVAGVLQHHRRARLVGTRTAGRAVVSRRFPLADGSALLITTARWSLPGGRRVEATGLAPDDEIVAAPPTRADLKKLRAGQKLTDPQLDAAAKLLRARLGRPAPGSRPSAPPR